MTPSTPERRGTRPTKAQRLILERMAARDEVIVCDDRYGNAWMGIDGASLNQRCFDALIRSPWLVGTLSPGGRYVRYCLSDAGRAALAACGDEAQS